jgi:hypothetical protein
MARARRGGGRPTIRGLGVSSAPRWRLSDVCERDQRELAGVVSIGDHVGPTRAGNWWASRPGAVGSGGQSYRFAGQCFDDDVDQVAGSWRGDRVACQPPVWLHGHFSRRRQLGGGQRFSSRVGSSPNRYAGHRPILVVAWRIRFVCQMSGEDVRRDLLEPHPTVYGLGESMFIAYVVAASAGTPRPQRPDVRVYRQWRTAA